METHAFGVCHEKPELNSHDHNIIWMKSWLHMPGDIEINQMVKLYQFPCSISFS